MSNQRWWATEEDPIFLARVNGEEMLSLVTFKDGVYQYLCAREGTPYTVITDIQPMKLIKKEIENDNNS